MGIISVFSLSVAGKTISWKVAAAAYATVVALGTLAGLLHAPSANHLLFCVHVVYVLYVSYVFKYGACPR